MTDILAADAWTRPWFGPLAPYETVTADNREFAARALGHRELPMPLMLQTQSAPAHFGAVTVGTIRQVVDTDAGSFGSGSWLNPEAVPEVNRALGLMAGGVAYVSPDLEEGTMVLTASERGGRTVARYEQATMMGATIVPIGAFDQVSLSTEPGSLERFGVSLGAGLGADELATFGLTGTTSWRTMPVAAREMEFDADDAVARILAWADGNDTKARSMFLWQNPESAVGTRARWNLPIGDIVNGTPHLVFHAVYAAAAIMSGAHGGMKRLTDVERQKVMDQLTQMYQRLSQAFKDPNLVAPWVKRAQVPQHKASMTASAAPVRPPAEWFDGSAADGPVTITEDGRVSGLLARWGTCHTGFGDYGKCVTPPRSQTGYAAFHRSPVLTASGKEIRAGLITLDTTHPVGRDGAMLNELTAAAHYDNTGSQVAIVRAGENKHGIWVAGALVPEATEEQVAKLRRSPLSGDWRDRGGNLELVAALAVNSPGFPVVGLGANQRQMSLTASAAVLQPCPGVDTGAVDEPVETVDEATPATPEPAPGSITKEEVAQIVAETLGAERLLAGEREELGRRWEAQQLVAFDELLTRLNRLPEPGGDA